MHTNTSEFWPWKTLNMSNLLTSMVLRYYKERKKLIHLLPVRQYHATIPESKTFLISPLALPPQTVQWRHQMSHWKAVRERSVNYCAKHWWTHKVSWIHILWTCCRIAPKQLATLHPVSRTSNQSTPILWYYSELTCTWSVEYCTVFSPLFTISTHGILTVWWTE